VNVGALTGAEKRTFTLSVEMLPPQAPVVPNTPNAAVKPNNAAAAKPSAAALAAGLKPPVPGQKR
jgi:hypothetical protein